MKNKWVSVIFIIAALLVILFLMWLFKSEAAIFWLPVAGVLWMM